MVQTSTIIIATAALSAASSLALPIELNEHTHFVREEDDLFARDVGPPVEPGTSKLVNIGTEIPKHFPGIRHILPKIGPIHHPLPRFGTPVGPLNFVSKIPVRAPLPKFSFPQTNLGRRELDERDWLSVAETVGKDTLKVASSLSNSNSNYQKQQQQHKRRGLSSEVGGFLELREADDLFARDYDDLIYGREYAVDDLD